MNDAALTLAFRLLTATAATVALGTMEACLCPGGGWQDTEVVELGISADLHAAVPLSDRDGSRWYRYLAVGAAGTVVAWGNDADDTGELFVESHVVGDADLRAAWAEQIDTRVEHSSWWVVGDVGTAAVSIDRGQTWTPVDLGTSANLHAITDVGGPLVVVGDEVVRITNVDGAWSEPPTPAGGWGRLRGLHHDADSERVWAVGLDGVIWSAEDPSEAWVAEASGVGTDLRAIGSLYEGRIAAVGAEGTFLLHDASGWNKLETGEQHEFVSYGFNRVLAANGDVFEVEPRNDKVHLEYVDTFAGAQAFSSGTTLMVVGDLGTAAEKDYLYCK